MKWLLIEEHLVQLAGSEEPPTVRTLTDKELTDYLRTNAITDTHLRVQIFEIGKAIIQTNK